MKQFILCIAAMIGLSSCLIQYKFNGASIDYSKIKTIAIADFPNNAALVYAPLSNDLSEGIRDQYTKQTRLQVNRRD